MNTPKTDELDRHLHEKGILADRYSDMLDHARKLEAGLIEIRDWIEDMGNDDDGEGACNVIARINELI